MKVSLTKSLFALPLAAAFPSHILENAAQDPQLMARAEQLIAERQISADAARAVFEPSPIFNAKAQYVNVGTGSGHEFQPPTGDDIRGPCPGLNAFANHGFLPHNGWATADQFIDATMSVVGMGPILAAFLAVFGAAVDGDGTAWSIGGTPTIAQGGALGHMSNGISGSHNKYESDASPTRPDLYETGNDYKLITSQWQKLIDMSPGEVTMDSLTKFRSYRFDTQIANNPYFFNGPFTGVLVQPAAYTFIYRFMANHTAERPEGILTHDTLASWFAMSDDSGTYTWTEGHERIPDNWYRRPLEYPYENTYFFGDLAAAIALYPKFANVGGNMGKTNSFAGVNVENLSGGAMNSQDLLQGNNAACLAMQFATQVKPDLALNPLSLLSSSLGKMTSAVACPDLQKIDQSQLEQFPGYNKK